MQTAPTEPSGETWRGLGAPCASGAQTRRRPKRQRRPSAPTHPFLPKTQAWGYPSKGYPPYRAEAWPRNYTPPASPLKIALFLCPAFSVMHLIIISSSFLFAATARGGAVSFSTRRKKPKTRGGRDPSTPGLSCLSLAAHFSLSAWPACALRVTKRRPLYRNTRNLRIAKVSLRWGYGSPEAGKQHLPPAAGELFS